MFGWKLVKVGSLGWKCWRKAAGTSQLQSRGANEEISRYPYEFWFQKFILSTNTLHNTLALTCMLDLSVKWRDYWRNSLSLRMIAAKTFPTWPREGNEALSNFPFESLVINFILLHKIHHSMMPSLCMLSWSEKWRKLWRKFCV